MPNHLANETSPYLLQHKDNPVDWHPWGPEALALSKKTNKPIFLSIGYSACHWCHVMEHESFEDERIAQLINEHFIPIKVDREERPDIDQIYMNAVQMMTGRGGWPMSVFLTPELKPFFAGTYYPPKRRGQMAGFDEVLNAVNTAWTERREQVEQGADQITEQLKQIDQAAPGALNEQLITAAVSELKRTFDNDWGGFGAAPKFPHTMEIQLLLRSWHRTGDRQTLEIVETTLDRMAAGGIYDHLGGGFARYSVDERWLVPHFEKMLYDNALLTRCYTEASLATDDKQTAETYQRVVRETLDYVLRDMTDEAGGFYSTEDADSEGEEGKFYVWTPAELQQILGAEPAETFARVYDVSESGNFEGNNILNLPKSLSQAAKVLGRDQQQLAAELAASRAKLFAAREKRVRPAKDDKVIVAWNGLMIDAMAFAGATLGEPRYLDAARKAADFLLKNLRRDDGRLLHTWRHGKAKLDAYLDDYTALANGLVTLYESTFAVEYLEAAIELMQFVEKHFSDSESGGFFYTADDHEELLTRNKDLTDGATPGGNSLAAYALLRLAKLTGSQQDATAAQRTLEAAAGLMERAPMAMGEMLVALDFYLGPTYELVLAGKPDDKATQAALSNLRGRFLPNAVVALAKDDAPAKPLADLLFGKSPGDEPMLYVCENFTCRAPSRGTAAINEALDKLGNKSQGRGLLGH